MVLHNLKCVFVHIPKTGGITISSVLKIPPENLGHQPLSNKTGWDSNYFKFAFVRNPWERFLSCYFYFKKYGRKETNDVKDGELVNKFKDFNDFAESFGGIRDQFSQKHFYSQLYWIDENLDFIGRCDGPEKFHKDFGAVGKKLNLGEYKLPCRNASKHKHYSTYYTDKTRKLVGEWYKEDIEYFGYEFGK